MNVNEDAIGKKGRLRGMGRNGAQWRKRKEERNGWKAISGADTRINRVKSAKTRRSPKCAKGAERKRVTWRGGGWGGQSWFLGTEEKSVERECRERARGREREREREHYEKQ